MRELVLHKDLQEDELVMRAAIRLLREHAENSASFAPRLHPRAVATRTRATRALSSLPSLVQRSQRLG